MSEAGKTCLPDGLPAPVPESDGLSAPFWEGLRKGRLLLQCCASCGTWQWGPEWICHRCHSFDLDWREAEPVGEIASVVRVWHPAHPALRGAGPYRLVLVELPAAGRVRMIGNLLGDPMREAKIGARVRGVFEHHLERDPAYTLLQWELVPGDAC